MYTKLIDDQINQLEAVMDVHEGTPTILVEDALSWLYKVRGQILSNQKYTVQVFPNRRGYLNVLQSEAFFLNTPEETSEVQTHFTQVEINEFKKRKDLAIDWDRVIIEPVKAES